MTDSVTDPAPDNSRTKATASRVLAADGIGWDAPAVEVYDALLYAGWTPDECDDAMRWLA